MVVLVFLEWWVCVHGYCRILGSGGCVCMVVLVFLKWWWVCVHGCSSILGVVVCVHGYCRILGSGVCIVLEFSAVVCVCARLF